LSISLQLYLIRHGQTAWSLTGQHTGSTDLALTEQGEAEARALAPQLQKIQFSRVLSSPALRARRTCDLARLGSGCETDSDLREWNYGDYEGKRTDDIRRDRPDWNLWRDGCPNGDTAARVAARADRLLARCGAMSGNVALFLHGHFAAALAVRWILLPLINGEHFPLRPAAIGILGNLPIDPQVPAILMWNVAPIDVSLRP
jgi:broad specificity phosphatase PhoE